MSEEASVLITEDEETGDGSKSPGTGILPSHAIRELVRAKAIQGSEEISVDQVQPASIDLRLGTTAYRLRASFLPGSRSTVEDKIRNFGMHAFDITEGAVLEVGCVYIVPLLEYLALPPRVWGLANPKSSTGRIDVLTRLITDHAEVFDKVKEGYHGRLYAEISPRTFSVVVRKGSKLSQLRLRRGSDSLSAAMHHRLHEEFRLVDRDLNKKGPFKGIPLTVDLQGEATDGLLGFRARQHADLIDVENIGYYEPIDYWEPIFAREHKHLILNPGDFYILASKEAVNVPPQYAAEMVAYDTLIGEFRVHYAGFFDPGFGYAESGGAGSRAVLEVRSHEVPFLVEEDQVVGSLIYDKLTDVPDKIYGTRIGSSYQRQGLALSKHFKPLA
ncbi:MAG: 2'-deoxycytidine 5'-triphosphate deaminase [Alphaproteobacteria bacterium]|nr:2'-deoxycytidine 5'-triphosphate deaminase [Alphaproteobacteria bacterium]